MKQAAPKRRFDLHRIFSSAEIVLVGKDLGAIWRNKGARALLMLLPVVLVVLVPLLYSVAISFLPTEESLAMPERLAAMLHGLEGHGPASSGWRLLPRCCAQCFFSVCRSCAP